MKRNNKQRRSNKSNALYQHIPPSATSFNGPLTTTVDSSVMTFYVDAAISTSAAGVVQGVFNNDPSISVNWLSYASSWNEYRVLGARYSFVPGNVVNTATIAGFTGYHSIVRGLTSPAPASLSDAASAGISRAWTAFKPFNREWRMMDVEEATFVRTGFPAATSNTLSIYATGGTASTTYGHLLIMYLVQFRGHSD
jgi:hypothetical protein